MRICPMCGNPKSDSDGCHRCMNHMTFTGIVPGWVVIVIAVVAFVVLVSGQLGWW